MDKTTRQLQGIKIWLKANGIGTWNWTMRFGKTYAALMAAERFNTNSKYKDEIILVIVPSVAIKNVWEDEIREYEYDFKPYLIIETVDTILNSRGMLMCGLLIIDEIHKYSSDRRLTIINGSKVYSKFKLGLTGTYDYNNKVVNQFYPVVDTIEENEALSNKWISNFIEFNVPLQLNEDDRIEYIKYNNIISSTFKTFKDSYKRIHINGIKLFDSEFAVILACYSGTDYNGTRISADTVRHIVAKDMGWYEELPLDSQYNNNIEDNWSPKSIKSNVTEFYVAMRLRNNIHDHNIVKLYAVADLYEAFKHRHFIIFNESTAFADIIRDTINNIDKDAAIAYHSEVKGIPLVDITTGEYFNTGKGTIKLFGKVNILKYINEYFNINAFNVISTVKALDEGLSIDNIDFIITTSGTVNPTQYTQRKARGLTVNKYAKDKITIIVNLFFDNFMGQDKYGNEKVYKSRDKQKMTNRQLSNDIRTISLSELCTNVKL